MSTTTASSVLDSCTLIYVEVDQNSNKVWRGKLDHNGTFTAEWGRVGSSLQSKQHHFGSVTLAQDKFARTKRQKLRKGYTEAKLADADIKQNVIKPEELEYIASKQIEHGRDPRSQELIRYLVKRNVHEIINQTNITYTAAGGFRTPLGTVTPEAIRRSQKVFNQNR